MNNMGKEAGAVIAAALPALVALQSLNLRFEFARLLPHKPMARQRTPAKAAQHSMQSQQAQTTR